MLKMIDGIHMPNNGVVFNVKGGMYQDGVDQLTVQANSATTIYLGLSEDGSAYYGESPDVFNTFWLDGQPGTLAEAAAWRALHYQEYDIEVSAPVEFGNAFSDVTSYAPMTAVTASPGVGWPIQFQLVWNGSTFSSGLSSASIRWTVEIFRTEPGFPRVSVGSFVAILGYLAP